MRFLPEIGLSGTGALSASFYTAFTYFRSLPVFTVSFVFFWGFSCLLSAEAAAAYLSVSMLLRISLMLIFSFPPIPSVEWTRSFSLIEASLCCSWRSLRTYCRFFDRFSSSFLSVLASVRGSYLTIGLSFFGSGATTGLSYFGSAGTNIGASGFESSAYSGGVKPSFW